MTKPKQLARFFPPQHLRHFSLAIVVVGFAVIGAFFTWSSFAATSAIGAEVEDGSIAGSAQIIPDAQASGGKVVRFNAPAPGGQAGFAAVCGMQICIDGKPFIIHGATTYGQLDDPAKEVALAKSAGLNTLEIVNFEQDYRVLSSVTSETTWKRVDNFIAEAKANNIRIILNLSGYSHAVQASGQKPTTHNWNNFLDTVVTNRINTKTGIAYKDEPTIIMIELVGEIDAPNYHAPNVGTTAETTEFFKRTLGQLKALDKKHLLSTGGFSYINDPGSGIDWRTIVADPNNDVCGVEINSGDDRNISVPAMSSYCNSIGKPWFLAAWSSCQGPKDTGFDDINHWSTDAFMAAHAQDMYNIARNKNPTAPGPAVAAIGSDFWNLGDTPYHEGNCDIGPRVPLSFATIKTNSP